MSDPAATLGAVLDRALSFAKKSGADAADALCSVTESVSVTRRMGAQESLTRSEDRDIGLRVFVGKGQAIVSSSDHSDAGLQDMAARAVAMARAAPPEPYAHIAPADILARISADDIAQLDLYDATRWSVEKLNALADAAEQAALTHAGVTNSEGATAGQGHDTYHYAASNGFSAGYASSSFYISVVAIAGDGDAMQAEYDSDAATHAADLEDPAKIGRDAAQRAVASLDPRRPKTTSVPVVFDARLAGGLIGSLAAAVSGGLVARGTSLLKDKMGQRLFRPEIVITDDPFLRRGPRSHPFDAEGVRPHKRNIIEQGVLTGWILDLASAKQLGLTTTGNASRGASSVPQPRAANFTLQPGRQSRDDLIADIKSGLLVTELMGSGADLITGDYSRGARGFWIENGKVAYPVAEITIAGNIIDMWAGMIPANDLKIRSGVDAPSILVPKMMVAGA
jgi:PmbA protein